MTPKQSVERACRERGSSVVIASCMDLLAGNDDVDPSLVHALGGPPASWAVSGGEGGPDYWLRVWAARGLLWAWDEAARPSVEKALSDPAWRVREMAAKVAARHRLGDLMQPLEQLHDDPNPRVQLAAERALSRIVRAKA